MIKKIKMLSKSIEKEIIDLRRKIHQNPELKFQEKNTAKLVKDYLSDNHIKVYSNYNNTTAVLGEIGNGDMGPTVALRADMDALPITETTGLPFSSKIPGKMHACGHDAHVAILLGAANLLSRMKEKVRGRIIFVFQPAEEGGGGAEMLVKSGLIENFNISMFFGHHVWPQLPAGMYGIKSGALTSIADRIEIEIDGTSAHGSEPHKGKNPIFIALHLIQNIQEMISNEISPYEIVVMNICKIESGTTHNIIPNKAQILGTMRCFSKEIHQYLIGRLDKIASCTADIFNTNIHLSVRTTGNSVINDSFLKKKVEDLANEYWGQDSIQEVKNTLMIGEDFAIYSEKVPSFFGLLGNDGLYGLHNSNFVFDESMIDMSMGWTAYLALKSLGFGVK